MRILRPLGMVLLAGARVIGGRCALHRANGDLHHQALRALTGRLRSVCLGEGLPGLATRYGTLAR